jgi:hypothetical protein
MDFESQDKYEEFLEAQQERDDWESEQHDVEKDRNEQ